MDSIFKQVTILDNIKFNLPNDTLICNLTTKVLFPDKFFPSATYLWNTGSSDSAITAANEGEYWVRITYGKCVKYDTCQIFYDQQRVELLSDTLLCNPETKELDGLLSVKGDFKNITWYSDPAQIPAGYSDSIAIIHKKGYFRIEGEKADGCPYSDSISIEGDLARAIFKFANVFTPNGDGLNDLYPDKNPGYDYHICIFDRWGIKVFETDNIPWNSGSFPNGTYFYFIEARGCGESVKTHGSVQVIKD
jgi:gliding motility-associated-like protein